MTRIHLKQQGSGPALVFIHGFCETSEIWTEFIKLFTPEFHVITLDLPGFGKSEIIPGNFTIDQVADSVADVLTANKISKAIIIGHSLGGYVTLSLLQNHPELLCGLVLFHSSSIADSVEKKDNRNKVIEFVKKNGIRPFIDTFVPGLFYDKEHPSISTAYTIAQATAQETLINYTAAMRERPDRTELWGKNAISKLLIAGTEDTSIPIAVSREMSRTGLHVLYEELPKTGHMGFFEAKNECASIIKRFTYAVSQ